MRADRARHFAQKHGQLLLEEHARRQRYLIRQLFPETGPLSRYRYAKNMEFFRAGAQHRERLLLAANRIGKTLGAGAFEVALHLTGCYEEYAPWWEGRRFDHPIKAWAAGDTSKTVRDIIQPTLLGPTRILAPADPQGTRFIEREYEHGVLPPHLVIHRTPKAGVPDAIESIHVRHKSGGVSVIQLKSYDQKRESFQGTSQDLIWLDEEPPLDIYSECLLRTMTTDGLIMMTFTPLMGMTDLIQLFMPSSDTNDAHTEAQL